MREKPKTAPKLTPARSHHQPTLDRSVLRKGRRPSLPSVLLGLCLALLLLAGCSGIDPALIEDILGSTAGSGPLDEQTVARGLRQALEIGTGRAVDRTSTVDGYLANELIRIALPRELESMARTLRRVGFGKQVDRLEVAMNRAAENAVGEARAIFVDAILDLSIADAFGILRGGESAATDYLQGRTADELRRRFRPIIADKMAGVGLYRSYEQLAEVYNALPLSGRPAVDLEEHLTERALDGLFTVLAQEEKRIREDPIARTTELLRRVFGSIR